MMSDAELQTVAEAVRKARIAVDAVQTGVWNYTRQELSDQLNGVAAVLVSIENAFKASGVL